MAVSLFPGGNPYYNAARMAARDGAQDKRTVKTTVDLPEKIWRAAKIRAMDDRVDLRSIVIAALEAYLRLNHRAESEPSGSEPHARTHGSRKA
jgi:hypothetical protein